MGYHRQCRATEINQDPPQGLSITGRKAGGKGGTKRWLGITIGAQLAKAAAFVGPEHKVRLMLGSGSDAGSVAIVNDTSGDFEATRLKNGTYRMGVRASAAEGLFSLTIPPTVISQAEAIKSANGRPPMIVFRAPAALLAVEDD